MKIPDAWKNGLLSKGYTEKEILKVWNELTPNKKMEITERYIKFQYSNKLKIENEDNNNNLEKTLLVENKKLQEKLDLNNNIIKKLRSD